MATLYIHIGMEKTGTTSLQNFFAHNRKILREHNVVYPKFDRQYEWISRDVNAFWLMTREKDENFRKTCFQKINRLAKRFDKILISAETLWNDSAYKPEFWEYLRANVDPSVEIKLIAYIRRQDSFIYSRWEQSVKSQSAIDKNIYTFKEYIESGTYRHNRLDYGEYLRGIEPVIGRENMLIRVFEPKNFKDGSLIADFIELLGIKLDDSYNNSEERKNETIRGGVLETKRLLNHIKEFKKHENRIFSYLVSAQNRLAGTDIMRECEGFTKQERETFLEQYKGSNAWVAREFFGREDGMLFSGFIPEEKNEPPYTTKEIAKVCGLMMLEMMGEKRELNKQIKHLKGGRMKLSIVVPVYNVQKYLEKGLDSILLQDFDSFEVICVDDASSDGSAEIMKEYEKKDSRVRCIYNKKNASAAACRKEGVLASTGEYVMFMDADDYFEEGALKKAYKKIKEMNVDILQFGTNIENCAGLPEKQIMSNEKALYPYTSEILRGDLLYACYAEHRISVTLWNKIVRGTVCRQAFARMEDGYFPKANDLYATFLICYYASSFTGLKAKLYHYCFGRGMTGHMVFNMEQFTVHCQGAKVYDALRRFAESLPEADRERVFETLKLLKKRLLNEQLNKWWNNLDPDYREEGLLLIEKTWNGGEDFILSALADAFLYRRSEIADYIIHRYNIDYRPREIRTIMLYYRSLHGGGAQRVVAQLASLFAEDGRFRVIVVTDEEPNEKDFKLHEAVERVYIPHCDEIKNTGYLVRARKWKEILDRYPIDVFLDSNWLASVSFFDMICIKKHASRPAFVFHTHSFFAMLYRLNADSLNEMYITYAAADAVVALSGVDRQYWLHINHRSYQIGNPIQVSGNSGRTKYGKRILWLARIGKEKRPNEIIKIMQIVLKEVPDAVCDVVGGGDTELTEELREEIEKAGLKNHILLHGMQTDTGMYYSQASVFLVTSEYEGFSLALYESASYGLPTVMYELPWLEYCRTFQGFGSVPQKDAKAAAEQISRLLTDEEYWEKQSNLIYDSFEAYRRYDIKHEWEKVFSDLEKDAVPDSPAIDANENIMLSQAARFHAIGKAEKQKYCENKTDNLTHKIRLAHEVIEKREDRIKKDERRIKKLSSKNETLKHKLKQAENEKAEMNRRADKLEKQVSELKRPVKYAAKKIIKKVAKKEIRS